VEFFNEHATMRKFAPSTDDTIRAWLERLTLPIEQTDLASCQQAMTELGHEFVRVHELALQWIRQLLLICTNEDADYYPGHSLADRLIRTRRIRVHQDAAGEPLGQAEEEMGCSRGGKTTKIHAVVDALGNPVRLILSEGPAAVVKSAEPLLED
jgi:hypothetical protein